MTLLIRSLMPECLNNTQGQQDVLSCPGVQSCGRIHKRRRRPSSKRDDPDPSHSFRPPRCIAISHYPEPFQNLLYPVLKHYADRLRNEKPHALRFMTKIDLKKGLRHRGRLLRLTDGGGRRVERQA